MYLKVISIAGFLATCLLAGVESAKKGDGHGHPWGYEGDTGPENWKKWYPKCGGKKQSPIEIDKDALQKDEKLGRIKFTGYETKIEEAMLTNNGHTVQLTDKDTEATISGGGLPGTYKFVQLHFHWGRDDDRGSEHFIEGEDSPLEMHLVHVNKRYGDIKNALSHEDGLAVLGIMFELSDKDNVELGSLIDALDDVRSEGDSATLEGDFDLDQLIPDDTLPYYRYEGSLTTPDCSEAVIWTVFEHKQHISKKQLEQFRSLKEKGDGDPDEELEDNFRPLQPLNGRKVKVSIDTGDEDDPDEDDAKKDDDDDDDNGGDGSGHLAPSIFLAVAAIINMMHRAF